MWTIELRRWIVQKEGGRYRTVFLQQLDLRQGHRNRRELLLTPREDLACGAAAQANQHIRSMWAHVCLSLGLIPCARHRQRVRQTAVLSPAPTVMQIDLEPAQRSRDLAP